MLRKSKGSGFKMAGYQAHENSPLSSDDSWWGRLKSDIKSSLHPKLGGTGLDPSQQRSRARIQEGNKMLEDQAARHKESAARDKIYRKYHDEYDTVGIKDRRDGTTEWGGAETEKQYRARMNDIGSHKKRYAEKKMKEHYANLEALKEQKLNSQTPLTEEQIAMAEEQGSKRPPLMKRK